MTSETPVVNDDSPARDSTRAHTRPPYRNPAVQISSSAVSRGSKVHAYLIATQGVRRKWNWSLVIDNPPPMGVREWTDDSVCRRPTLLLAPSRVKNPTQTFYCKSPWASSWLNTARHWLSRIRSFSVDGKPPVKLTHSPSWAHQQCCVALTCYNCRILWRPAGHILIKIGLSPHFYAFFLPL